MAKPWGTVETLVTYTRSMMVSSVERKKHGIRVYYANRNPKDDPLSIFIAYRNILHLSKKGLDSFLVTYLVEEWSGAESLHCEPKRDDTGMWKCTSYSSQRKFFVGRARFFLRNGNAWPEAE